MTPLKVGDLAPPFDLTSAQSEPLSMADFRGQVLILYFYPKADTTGCTREAQDFSGLSEEFAQAGATVVGVSPDSPEKLRRFADKYGLKVSLASDPEHRTAERYGAWDRKSMYGRWFMGVIRSTFLIDPHGRIGRIWPKVRVPGHAAEVLAALRDSA